MSAAIVECPICMDPIDTTRNCTTTECGHCFHAKCLMTSVAHNGFNCPYCRTRMADEVAEEEDEYDDYENDSVEDEQYDDYALRGLRFFTNNLDGEEHDEEDVEEETIETENEEGEESEAGAEDDAAPPPVSYLAQKLMEQGVTTEDLLKAILCSCHDYQRDYEDFERVESEIVGRVSTILNNYIPPVV